MRDMTRVAFRGRAPKRFGTSTKVLEAHDRYQFVPAGILRVRSTRPRAAFSDPKLSASFCFHRHGLDSKFRARGSAKKEKRFCKRDGNQIEPGPMSTDLR